MAKVTFELDTESSESVRQVYLMVLQLANLHFPAKKEEVKTGEGRWTSSGQEGEQEVKEEKVEKVQE